MQYGRNDEYNYGQYRRYNRCEKCKNNADNYECNDSGYECRGECNSEWQNYGKFCNERYEGQMLDKPGCAHIIDMAHIGMGGATMLIGGPVGNVPLNKFFVKKGYNILETNPVKIKGNHAYLVEWSGAVDPVDLMAQVRMEIMLDGNPVEGSENSLDVLEQTNGKVALSGGAVVLPPYDNNYHTLELRLATGMSGAEVSHVNMRIIQLY